jgi:hypothetical protein
MPSPRHVISQYGRPFSGVSRQKLASGLIARSRPSAGIVERAAVPSSGIASYSNHRIWVSSRGLNTPSALTVTLHIRAQIYVVPT